MTTANDYDRRFNGSFEGMLHWPQLDALWAAMRAAPDGWFLVEHGRALPHHPLAAPEFLKQLGQVDALLRREHRQTYCGIVYADDAAAPGMVKVFDPRGLGSMCSSRAEPTPAHWVFTRLAPQPPTPNRSTNHLALRKGTSMTVNRAVSIFAGFMIMLTLALAHFMGQIDLSRPSWLWFTAFVGANLFQMGFTGFCPAARIFRALGLKDRGTEGSACCS